MSDGISMQIVLSEVAAERVRQDRDRGGPCDYLAILIEALVKEVNEASFEEFMVRAYAAGPSRAQHLGQLRAELIQVAAVAVAMVEALDRRTAREAAEAPEAPPATTPAPRGGTVTRDEFPEADLTTVESEG